MHSKQYPVKLSEFLKQDVCKTEEVSVQSNTYILFITKCMPVWLEEAKLHVQYLLVAGNHYQYFQISELL